VDEVVIADVSMGMLKQTPRTALKPVCSHSESLPFPDDFFERVIMVDALHHVIDQPASAREMFRVLKPGGRIIIEEPDIRAFAVKLIALAEKLLLMRSHFLAPSRISALFPEGSARIVTEDASAWVVISK
jgi:demethylmenaquinone methyltransferase/2-methoxy-6-polyprenyl-1,4-benzoquinol methylase